MRPATAGDRCRRDQIGVPHTASAVLERVRVQQLAPRPGSVHAEPVPVPDHRREVEYRENARCAAGRVAQDPQRAGDGLARVCPLEAGRLEVELMQSLLGAVEPVEIADAPGDPRVRRVIEEVPVEAPLVVPLAPLPELRALEQQLLAGLRVLVGEQQPQRRQLLPRVAGKAIEERALRVRDLVV